MPPFPKKWLNVLPEQCLAVFLGNTAFFEKIVYLKNIRYPICEKKVIFISGLR